MSKGVKTDEKKSSGRKTYLDVLRIVAVFLVIYAHSRATGKRIYESSGNIINIWGGLFLDCFRCCNNWLFLMISGALLLRKEESVRTILVHRVLRMIAALSLFSVFYEIVEGKYVSISGLCQDILYGNVKNSFWFIYSYIGYLLMLPVLRAVAQHITELQMKYLIALYLIFDFILPNIYAFTSLNPVGIQFLLGKFLIYPLIGYYLSNHEQSNRTIVVLGIVSCIGLILCSIASYNQYIDTGSWSEDYIYRSESVCAIFLFCLAQKIIKSTDVKFWAVLSSTAFGIYFMAPYLQDKLKFIFDHIHKFLPVIPSNMLFIICVMMIAAGITLILKKIPVLKRVL